MNFSGTTIEQLLESDAATLEAMSDVELDKFFNECLKICPAVTMMEPVADAEPRQTSSLRGVRGGTPVRKQTRSKFTLEPQTELGKQLSAAEKLKQRQAALQKELDML